MRRPEARLVNIKIMRSFNSLERNLEAGGSHAPNPLAGESGFRKALIPMMPARFRLEVDPWGGNKIKGELPGADASLACA